MRVTQQFLLALATTFGLFASGPALAGLYKWVDDQGNVTYSQVPPPDRKATTIAPPPPPPEGSAPRYDYSDSTGNKSRQSDPVDANAEKDLAAMTKKNCEISKRNLMIYKTQGRIKTETGQVMDLDEQTRAAKVAQAEKDVKAFCQ